MTALLWSALKNMFKVLLLRRLMRRDPYRARSGEKEERVVSTAHATSAKVISLELYLVFPSPSLPISLLPHLYLFLSFLLSLSLSFLYFFSPFSLSLSLWTPNTHTHNMTKRASPSPPTSMRATAASRHVARTYSGKPDVMIDHYNYEHITPPSISPLRHFLFLYFSLTHTHTQQIHTRNMPDPFFFIGLCFGCA